MGEVVEIKKELKKFEIIMVDVNGRQIIGKALIDDKASPPEIDTYTLINPALIWFQPITQPTKIGGVEFGVITQIIALGIDELNIEKEDIVWGIVTNKKMIEQYEMTFKDERRIVNA